MKFLQKQDLEVLFPGSEFIYHERSKYFHTKIQGLVGEMEDGEFEPQHRTFVFVQVICARLYPRLNCILNKDSSKDFGD